MLVIALAALFGGLTFLLVVRRRHRAPRVDPSDADDLVRMQRWGLRAWPDRDVSAAEGSGDAEVGRAVRRYALRREPMSFVLRFVVPIYALVAFLAWGGVTVLVSPARPVCLGLPDSVQYCVATWQATWDASRSDFERFIASPIPYFVVWLVASAATVAIARRTHWH